MGLMERDESPEGTALYNTLDCEFRFGGSRNPSGFLLGLSALGHIFPGVSHIRLRRVADGSLARAWCQ